MRSIVVPACRSAGDSAQAKCPVLVEELDRLSRDVVFIAG